MKTVILNVIQKSDLYGIKYSIRHNFNTVKIATLFIAKFFSQILIVSRLELEAIFNIMKTKNILSSTFLYYHEVTSATQESQEKRL